jgi:hypothetical protein
MMLAPELHSVIERCLAKKMDDRFASVAELAQALAPFGTPDTAREYVGRIYQLLGNDRPSEESLSRMTQRERPQRAATPVPPQTEVVEALPPMDHFITTTRDKRSRRFPWIAMLLVALVTSGATILALVLLRGESKPDPVTTAPSAPTIPPPTITPVNDPVDAAPKPSTPDIESGSAKDAGSAKVGTGSQKIGTGSQKINTTQKVGTAKVGSGAKVGTGSAKAGSAKKCDPAKSMHGC